MAHYPQNATGLGYITYPVGPAYSAVILNPGASINTKGVYTQIVASTPFAVNSVRIGLSGLINNTQTWLCDIAIGASGSEVIIIPNLMSDQSTTGSSVGNAGWYDILVSIPAGTRISARCQCNVASRNLGLYVTLIGTGGTPGISSSSFTTYGANAAGSRGTNVDPGATINTKGIYSQITASTTSIIQWMMLQFGHFGASYPNGISYLFDIATGGAGAEIILIPDIRIEIPAASPGVIIPRSYSFLTYIPIGTRIAVRCSGDAALATSRTMDVVLLTASAPVESSGGASSVAYLG